MSEDHYYVPPSGNPVQSTVEEWDRLRAEYMSVTDQLRVAESEIRIKDARITDLTEKVGVLQHERDAAVTVAAEIRGGLTHAGSIVLDLAKRYEAVAASFRMAPATMVANTVAEPVPETPAAGPWPVPDPVQYFHRTPLPDGPGFVNDGLRPYSRPVSAQGRPSSE